MNRAYAEDVSNYSELYAAIHAGTTNITITDNRRVRQLRHSLGTKIYNQTNSEDSYAGMSINSGAIFTILQRKITAVQVPAVS